jgi:hypothetical protein
MKKIAILALGACMFIATADAQKQSGGEKNLQVLFAPLGGNPISINGISFRKFSSDGKSAWRVNLFIGLNNKTDIVGQPVDTGSFATGGGVPEADKKTTGMTISIRPGYEMHMAGTEALSPYWGVEAMFSMTTAKVETDTVGVANYTNSASSTGPTAYQVYTTTQKGKGASTTFGINLFAGADYYIAKNLSLGAEIGFGFSTTSMPDIENQYVKETVTGTVPTETHTFTVTDAAKQKQGSSMQLGPNVIGQFKLGWLF